MAAAPLTAERFLVIAMRVVGAGFTLLFWPLTIVWPSGWVWHTGHTGDSYYLPMLIGIYATWGVFLVWASREPLRHLGLVWFTVWANVVHAAIMAVQAITGGPETLGHLWGDVPALLTVAVVLGVPAWRLR